MSDEQKIPDTEAAHTDYQPQDTRDAEGNLQLTGMYQNWFLDYASYVILERAVLIARVFLYARALHKYIIPPVRTADKADDL